MLVMPLWFIPNGSFTLPDTDTKTDKMCVEPMEICIGIDLGRTS